MKTHTRINIAIAALAFAALIVAGLRADPPETAASMTANDCRATLGEIMVMTGEIGAFDEALQKKLDTMLLAPESERLTGLEAVVEEMVEQRPVIRNRMKRTHQQMMRHLLLHMTTEDLAQRRTAMAECPIIQYLRRDEPTRGVGEFTQEMTY